MSGTRRPRNRTVPACLVAAGLVGGLLVESGPADGASRLLASTFNANPQTFSDNVDHFLAVDLSGIGTQVPVTVTARSTLTVQLAAVCRVSAADGVSRALVEILVDGIRLGLNRAFGTSAGLTEAHGGVGAAAQVSIEVDPGIHVVQIVARGVEIETGESYTIDDISLVVSRDHLSPLQ
jgi:hypothetical protein